MLFVGNQHGDQGLVLSVSMETRAWFHLWAWKPGLGSFCPSGRYPAGSEQEAQTTLSLQQLCDSFSQDTETFLQSVEKFSAVW